MTAPKDSMVMVMAVMDNVEGLHATDPREVRDPVDVARRVNLAYEAQGVTCDPATLHRAMVTIPSASAPFPASPKKKAPSSGGMPFFLYEPLMILGVITMIPLVAWVVFSGARDQHQQKSVAALLTSAIQQPLPQAMTHLTTDSALETVRALDPNASMEITEDSARHPTITVMASEDTNTRLGLWVLDQIPDKVEVWANGHRVHTSQDLAHLACPQGTACKADQTTFLMLRNPSRTEPSVTPTS